MHIRFTVTDPAVGKAVDVEVRADPDTPVSSVLAVLPMPVAGRIAYVGTTPLNPTSLLADGVLLPGAVLSLGSPGDPARALPEGTVGGLRVVSGPDRGLTAWVNLGSHAIARSPAATLRLADGEVSRRHAVLDIGSDRHAEVRDDGATNPVLLDGAALTAPTRIGTGQIFLVGNDQIEWVALPSAPRPVVPAQDCHLDFDRDYAPVATPARRRLALPEPLPAAKNQLLAPMIAALMPLGLAGVMWVSSGNPQMLIMGVLSPASAMSASIIERRRVRRSRRKNDSERAATAQQLSDLIRTQERECRALAPDRLDLTLAVTGASRGLWPRRAPDDDALTVRVGTADLPASIDLDGETWPELPDTVLRDSPVTLDLRQARVTGLVGPEPAVAGLLRWLLIQVATLRSPDDLRIVVITTADDDDLAWTAWLPHVSRDDGSCLVGNTPTSRAQRLKELVELITIRRNERTGATVGIPDDVLVVLDGATALRSLQGMKQLLRDGPTVGIVVLCADRNSMNEQRAECRIDSNGELTLRRGPSEDPAVVRPEQLSRDEAERMARDIAPMRDRLVLSDGQASIPENVRLLDLLGWDTPRPADVLVRWATQPGPTTAVPVGADATGTVMVDLAAQGPHTMLGGATGAGKSILLKTLVTSLLLANRPDELNMLLVDFKGGSTFLPFARLPHVVGLIRSVEDDPSQAFDEIAAQRFLTSVRTEVSRREVMLAKHGGELTEYWKARRSRPDLPALPRLLLILDEFARVLDAAPQFLNELVNVAGKGRSLGMHLVLATQSLQGKLSNELKNNIDLRISLRQNEPADSQEVLDAPDAAFLPGRLRGRGLILCTKDQPRTARPFQTGYLGDPPPDTGARPAFLQVSPWSRLGEPAIDVAPVESDLETDQQLTIEAIRLAAQTLAADPPFLPVLPPLPARLPAEQLSSPGIPATLSFVPIGLADDPNRQSQPAIGLDLAGADRLLVAGGPQTGRTTVAHTLITELAHRFGPDQAHVYVVEHRPGGLRDLESLPHCGAVVGADQPDRIRRLLNWFDGELERRRLSSGSPGPYLVLIIDGWQQFEDRADPAFVETSLLTGLRGLITAGPPLGIHVVLLGGQELPGSRIAQLYSQRLLLSFPQAETRRQYLPAGTLVPASMPGRAVDALTGRQVQLALPRDLSALPNYPPPAPSMGPRPFPPMPQRLLLDSLCIVPAAHGGPSILLGIGGPEVAPVRLDLFDAGPHLLLVSGPARSGRTTAAIAVVRSLRREGVAVIAVAPPRSRLLDAVQDDLEIRIIAGTKVSDAELRAAAEQLTGRIAVVIDDCEQITVLPTSESYTEQPTLLQDIAEPGSLGRSALVLCGDATVILSGQRRSLAKVVSEIVSSGSRLLLTPRYAPVAREHGFRLEHDQLLAGPPGRGYLTSGREVQLIQTGFWSQDEDP